MIPIDRNKLLYQDEDTEAGRLMNAAIDKGLKNITRFDHVTIGKITGSEAVNNDRKPICKIFIDGEKQIDVPFTTLENLISRMAFLTIPPVIRARDWEYSYFEYVFFEGRTKAIAAKTPLLPAAVSAAHSLDYSPN